MPKSGKRKSESAIPDARVKSRKKELVADYENGEEGSGEEEGDTETNTAPKYVKRGASGGKSGKPLKSRKSEPVMRVERVEVDEDEDDDDDEYGDDPDREESKEFLRLKNYESIKKDRAKKQALEFLNKFLETVKNDEMAVRTRREELQERESNKDQDFLKTFKLSYTMAAPFASSKDNAYNFASMHAKSEEIVARALELASRFDTIVEKTAAGDIPSLLENNWGEKYSTTANLLEVGKAVGLHKFECIMKVSEPDIMDDNTADVAEAFFPTPKNTRCIGWGKEAKKQMKATKKLIRTVESVQV